MARGWESKSIADQMESAEEQAPEAEREARPDSSPEARARRERLTSLKMSRSRTLEQLERATNERHREMLKGALRALEAEIENLK